MTDKFYNITVGSLETSADENGYINATKICNLFNKEFKQWRRQAQAKTMINSVAKEENMPSTALLRTFEGGKVKWRGTYVHPRLIVGVISWCSQDNVISMGNALLAEHDIKYTLPKPMNHEKIDKESGIYLVELGSVKNCRPHLNLSPTYDDDYLVCKYGISHNIPRRMVDHAKTYTFDNVVPKLIYSRYIDCRYNYAAEAQLAKVFGESKIRVPHDKYKELIFFPRSFLETIELVYDGLCYRYQSEAP